MILVSRSDLLAATGIFLAGALVPFLPSGQRRVTPVPQQVSTAVPPREAVSMAAADSLLHRVLGRGVIPGSSRAQQAPPASSIENPPRPVFRVVAIAFGARPAALVQGFPGVELPRLVLAGDTVSGYRVRLIARDSVVIAGADTVWFLPLDGGRP